MTEIAEEAARKVCREHGAYNHDPKENEGCAYTLGICESLVEAGLLGTATSQTEATLALVEQQRIANLIAYLEYSDVDDYEPTLTKINEALGL